MKERIDWCIKMALLNVCGVAVGARQNCFHRTGEPKTLYLGIDRHHKQMTISLRHDEGTVILKRQVSTQPAEMRAFHDKLRQQSGDSLYAPSSAQGCLPLRPMLRSVTKATGGGRAVLERPSGVKPPDRALDRGFPRCTQSNPGHAVEVETELEAFKQKLAIA